jgi:hypothetical protein
LAVGHLQLAFHLLTQPAIRSNRVTVLGGALASARIAHPSNTVTSNCVPQAEEGRSARASVSTTRLRLAAKPPE